METNNGRKCEPERFDFFAVCREVAKRMKKRNRWTESETIIKTGFYITDAESESIQL